MNDKSVPISNSLNFEVGPYGKMLRKTSFSLLVPSLSLVLSHSFLPFVTFKLAHIVEVSHKMTLGKTFSRVESWAVIIHQSCSKPP